MIRVVMILSAILTVSGCVTTSGGRVSESHSVSKYQPTSDFYYHVQGVDKSYSQNLVPDSTGTATSPNIFRVEVRNGDCLGKDCTGNWGGSWSGQYKERSELRMIPKSGNWGKGETVWFGVDVFIPEESKLPLMREQTTIAQTMVGKRKPNSRIKALFEEPTFGFIFKHGRLRANLEFGNNKANKHNEYRALTVADNIDDLIGKWTRLEWVIHFSNGAEGFARAYVNGNQVFEHKGDSMRLSGDVSQMKIGSYTNHYSFTPEYHKKNPDKAGIGTRVLFFDNASMAKSREELFTFKD